MAALNQVNLIGNLTRDVELSYLPSQTAIAQTGIAVSRKWKSKDGEDKSETMFIDLKIFGKQAETFNKYLSKGSLVFITGKLSFDQWEKDGIKHSRHRITVEGFQFLGGNDKPQTEETPEASQDNSDIPF
jgi:single-strand DNA-binding protein